MQGKNWIALFREELARSLPGASAQMRMAPSVMRSSRLSLPMRESGVLLLLYPINGKLHTVLMKRTEYGGPHSGQISLPGGKFEYGDASLVETALRESHEEIGIPPDAVEVLGQLTPLYIPVSNFQLQPVVGYTAERPAFKADPQEVRYLIETGLDILLDPEIIKTETLTFGELAMQVPYYEISGHHVWGATAMVLSEFLQVAGRVRET